MFGTKDPVSHMALCYLLCQFQRVFVTEHALKTRQTSYQETVKKEVLNGTVPCCFLVNRKSQDFQN